MNTASSSSRNFAGEVAVFPPISPVQEHFDELQKAQEHSFSLLNQVEARLLVGRLGDTEPEAIPSPGFHTELRNQLQSRLDVTFALNQRLQDLLERI